MFTTLQQLINKLSISYKQLDSQLVTLTVTATVTDIATFTDTVAVTATATATVTFTATVQIISELSAVTC